MFRKATSGDLDRINEIYDEIHTEEEAGRMSTGWVRGVYPSRETALAAITAGDMVVEVDGGTVVAAARINQEQVPEYAHADWLYPAGEAEVMVLHTLVVSPAAKGRGYGTKFVAFYEHCALEHGCRVLRIDTNERNAAARSLYKKLGYREASTVPCQFNGIEGVHLVCLEKEL